MANSILVTGGAGFIGSHLVENLLEQNHHVTVIDNFNDFYDPAIKRGNVENHFDFENYKLAEGDIRDADFINGVFDGNRFDEVIHIAAMAGVRPSIKNPMLYKQVNLFGTMNILEACRRFEVNKMIMASSSSVYGNNKKIPFSEDDPVDHPISPYAMTKKSCELMAYTYYHLFNIKTACLRFFTVYGPRQRPEMAIHLFTEKIMKGEEIEMFGDGSSARDYTYIDDIIDGVLKCREIDFEYEIINLGRSDIVKLRELIEKIQNATGKKARIKKMPRQPGDVNRTCADVSKAEKMLGFRPQVSIDRGLEKFVEWYINTRSKK